MAARLGNVLYWLGTIIAVLAIGGAVVWNATAYFERQDAEERLAKLEKSKFEGWIALQTEAIQRGMPEESVKWYIDRIGKHEVTPSEKRRVDPPRTLFSAPKIDSGRPEMREDDVEWLIKEMSDRKLTLNRFKLELLKRKIPASKEAQEFALFFGGVAALIGLVAYGVGWAARYILQGPVK